MKNQYLLAATFAALSFKGLLTSIFLLVNSISFGTVETVTISNENEIVYGRVISVKDGDSFDLLDDDNKIHQVRLAHVDTPEKKQPFGRAARIFTFNFVYGKRVKFYHESTDRYHRKIGIVEVEGKVLNIEIIKAGYAWHFKKYSKSIEHGAAENKAKLDKKGLWSQPNPVAPWNYRKHKR